MEHDDEEAPQALPEPPGAVAVLLLGRCGRHPAQPLAGVCSSCLTERLSSVGSPAHPEIVEVDDATPTRAHADRDHEGEGSVSGADHQGKLRKTLMLLFQMDDSDGAAHPPPEPRDPQPSSQAEEPPAETGGAKSKRVSWLRSILPKRGARRAGRKEDEEERPRPSVAGSVAGGGDATPQVERRASFRRSCEWMVCREPPHARGSSMDPPRHSWDGSMVGRALACSFACLDEPSDGVTRVRHSNADDGVTRVRHSNADESVAENRKGAAETRNGGNSADLGGEAEANTNERHSFRARGGNGAGPEMSVSGVGRRRSNRWSRVWDRSITSPLKEFVRKGEHALDRSFSESRKETRRCKDRDPTDAVDGEIPPGRNNGLVSGRASQSSTRSSQAAPNGDAQNFRTGWLKNKESRIGRSRSVHYTSPGNFDNGMLRFYLTPMRSNRSANRGRRRSSRLFSRGLFGFV
uniref:Uncharacterized protein n=1 Tax=Avena sativa TaxID=4498 RepID=A0ACD5WFJ5_AVESA